MIDWRVVLEVGIGACLDTKLLKVGDLRDQGIKHDAYIIFLLFCIKHSHQFLILILCYL